MITIRIKLRYFAYSLLFFALLVLIYLYDQHVFHYTIMPLRLLFDACLFILIFVPAYATFKRILLLESEDTSWTICSIKGVVLKSIPLANIPFILNILRLNFPAVGSLSLDMLLQGIEALPYLIIYMIACILNGFMLIVTFMKKRKDSIYVYDVAVYSVVFMALQIIVSMYGFHAASLNGIKYSLICLIALLSVIYSFSLRRKNLQDIELKGDGDLPLILILSLSSFALYYFCALYDHYCDQAIMLSNVNSILYRRSLEPYYMSSGYYPALGGFHIASFMYVTGLNNTILASTLSFTIAYLFLPIVVYRLFKLIINEGSVVIFVTVMAIYMDGLGILAYPAYKSVLNFYLQHNNVENALNIISFKISPLTCSLYSSTISQLWFNPYKVFAVFLSITSIVMLSLQPFSTYNLILAGLLLSSSFIHPKAVLIASLSLIILWGFRRINTIRNVIVPILVSIISLAPLAWAIIYKLIYALLDFYLPILSADETAWILQMSEHILKRYSVYFLTFVVFSLLALLIYRDEKFSVSSSSEKVLLRGTADSRLVYLFIYLSTTILLFATLYIHNLFPSPFIELIEQLHPLSLLKCLLIRYHVITASLFLVPLFYKITPRSLLSLLTVLFSIYVFELTKMYFSIPFLILVAPILEVLIKRGSTNREIIGIILIFICLGVLTNGLYGIQVISSKANSIYEDMPFIIKTLLKVNHNVRVYSGSTYNYFVDRTLSFAQISPSEDPSVCSLCLIDKKYGIRESLKNRDIHYLYLGKRLVLIELEDEQCA